VRNTTRRVSPVQRNPKATTSAEVEVIQYKIRPMSMDNQMMESISIVDKMLFTATLRIRVSRGDRRGLSEGYRLSSTRPICKENSRIPMAVLMNRRTIKTMEGFIIANIIESAIID
jgi:hypothetical protein